MTIQYHRFEDQQYLNQAWMEVTNRIKYNTTRNTQSGLFGGSVASRFVKTEATI